MLKGKITPALCLNLDEYETKLEQLNVLIQKMSAIDWTVDSAMQFCRDQGMQVENFMLPQFATLQSLYDDLNAFNYKDMEDKLRKLKNG